VPSSMVDIAPVVRISRTVEFEFSRIIRSPDERCRKNEYGSDTRWRMKPSEILRSSLVRTFSNR
jgi:hypothetical protein